MVVKTIWITEKDNIRLRNLIKDANGPEMAEGLRELEMQLDRARVVGSNQIPENVVTMNCVVRLRDPDSFQEWECWLRFSTEPKTSSHVVPILSTLGIALLGSKEGDIIEWTSPSGKKRSEVVEIVYQPERLGNYEL
jgi:regulator of nucleoside diphosphate kinase